MIESLIVIGIITVMIVALVKDAMRPGLVLFSAAATFMVLGIITPNEMISGFSNKGMLTVAVLFLVSEGVRSSGILNKIAQIALPQKRHSVPRLMLSIMVPISALSAFLNNTPVVIIFAPVIKRWAEKLQISPDKFLIPLSYATIFGGLWTLIGTSTNLVVHGMMLDNKIQGMSMFELFKIGFFITLGGWLYLAFIGRYLLPGNNKNGKRKNKLDSKDYYFNLTVTEHSDYIGEIIRKGKIRENKEITVVAVERGEQVFDPQNERVILQAGDNMLVCGYDDNIHNLIQLDGLKFNAQGDIDAIMEHEDLHRIEVVLAPRFPGIGSTLAEFDFYGRFKGIVVGIHRNGSSITSNMNNERLRPGDSLIILAEPDFFETWVESKNFFLISTKGEVEKPIKTYKIGWTVSLLLIMILGATFGEYLPTVKGNQPDMFFFATLAAVLMAILKIFPPKKYTRAISWDVLITIASAFAISRALINSGAAEDIAQTAINSVKNLGPRAVLAIIYLMTMIFTEIITNNAAAAISFPIAIAAASQLGVDSRPFIIAICVAASASFSTPIGYQTNLIVQSYGNYKFKDFLKVGLPLNIISFIISIFLIPLFWKF
jgi:di/tricarboxylate transporter